MFTIHFHEIKQVWGSRHVKAASSLGRCAEKPFNHGLVGSSLRFMPTAGPLAGALEEYLHKGYNIVEAALVNQAHCCGLGGHRTSGQLTARLPQL